MLQGGENDDGLVALRDILDACSVLQHTVPGRCSFSYATLADSRSKPNRLPVRLRVTTAPHRGTLTQTAKKAYSERRLASAELDEPRYPRDGSSSPSVNKPEQGRYLIVGAYKRIAIGSYRSTACWPSWMPFAFSWASPHYLTCYILLQHWLVFLFRACL